VYKFLNTCLPIYEISSESGILGRRRIKVVLHEIHPDTSVYQENGISWKEEYVKNNLRSVIGMSITVEFLTADRDIPYGHGMTDMRDNLPLFEDATMVGHFDNAYIDDLEIDGVIKRVLIAEGTLDEMRYPKFVAWLREHMKDSTVKGSVEIVGKAENENHIIYFDGWKEKGRVPQIYDYSGYAILGIKPADESAIVMELNNKKEQEDEVMEEKLKELMTAVSGISAGISESNSKWDEYWAKVELKDAEIAQLKADIAQKEAEIARLRADYETETAKSAAAEAGLAEANAKVEVAEASVAEVNAKVDELKKTQAVNELNAALEQYTEEQREIAKAEIEAFNENPDSVEINSIIGKICTEIVRQSRNGDVSELNSAIDVFSIVDSRADSQTSDGEVDIF